MRFRISLAMLTLFMILPAVPQASEKAAQKEASQLSSNPPPASKLNLGDLGFSDSQLKQDPEAQKLLEKRSSMLHTHQILGLTTLALMTATYFTAPDGGPASWWHRGFAGATMASYAATAYYSLSAPEPEGLSSAGWNIRLHKALMFVHLPGMILTPIAGIMAQKALREGKSMNFLARQKGALANITYFSFATAALTMVINF